jgi:hypothetical protein
VKYFCYTENCHISDTIRGALACDRIIIDRKAWFSATRLALANVHANRTGVPVLEVIHGEVAAAAHHVADSLASSAVTGVDGVGTAGGKGHGGDVAILGGLVAVGGVLVGCSLHLANSARSRARDGVAGSLKVLLLGKQEDGGALLASHGDGDVEVIDRAGVAVDRAVVRGAGGLVWAGRIDRDHQVRVLVGAVKILGARSLVGGRGCGNRSGYCGHSGGGA